MDFRCFFIPTFALPAAMRFCAAQLQCRSNSLNQQLPSPPAEE